MLAWLRARGTAAEWLADAFGAACVFLIPYLFLLLSFALTG